MQALADAFEKAGIKTPRDRLDALTREAIKPSPANWDAMRDRLYNSIRNDAALLWEIMEAERRRIFDEQIRRIRDKMIAEAATARAKEGGDGKCQAALDTHRPNARPVAADMNRLRTAHEPTGQDDGGGGQNPIDTHRHDASSAVNVKPVRAGEGADHAPSDTQRSGVRPSPNPIILARRAVAATEVAMLRNPVYLVLQAFRVKGKPFLDCTTEEVRDMRGRDMKQWAVEERVCSLIPNPDIPISKQITQEIVDQAGKIING